MSRNLGFKAVTDGVYYFVSYNSNDENIVSQYAGALNDAGIRMWYDDGLEIGEVWETQIADRIEGCNAVIMFLSKNIFKKENSYVRKEYRLARHFNKKIYVILVDEIKPEDIPNRFIGWWMDITEYQVVQAYQFSDVNTFAVKVAEILGVPQVSDKSETDKTQNTNRASDSGSAKIDTQTTSLVSVAESNDDCVDLISVTKKLMSKHKINQFKFFVSGSASFNKKIYKAIATYAPVSPSETIILMEDATILGSAKQGFVLTDKNIYLNLNSQKECIPVSNIRDVISANPGMGLLDIRIVTNDSSFKITFASTDETKKNIDFLKELLENIQLS